MKKLLLVCLVIINVTVTKAQFVNIPDVNFRNWLNANGYASCMNGNSLDASCPAVVNAYSIDCTNANISDLTGIEAFVNLTDLRCKYNLLTALPGLPSSLSILDCNANQITNLPPLPPNLTYLGLCDNQLTSLPSLPSTITDLLVCGNHLTSLPSPLPPGLVGFYCSNNLLTTLPTLPNTIYDFECYDNQLTSLPVLPTSVEILYCYNNQLANLPSLPASLKILKCYDNLLTSLPALPLQLQELDCSDNLLTGLPALPNSLWELYCRRNQLTNLPSLASLGYLFCNNNQINSLPPIPSLHGLDCSNNILTGLPSLPLSLQYIICSFNQLSNIPPLPSSLTELTCRNNQLTSLPSLPNSLLYLRCQQNQLVNLPILPNSLIALYCDTNQITVLPSLSSSIIWLYCAGNQLSTLPVLPNSLKKIYCNNNLLQQIPDLPDSVDVLYIKNNTVLTCFPRYKKINSLYWSNTGITCRQSTGTISSATPTVNALPICSPPATTITPSGPLTFCSGGSVTLNANAGASFTYRWIKNGSLITGATSQSYPATVSGNYSVEVTHNCGFATSAAVTVTVNSLPSAAITPVGPATFCSGSSVVLNAPTGANKTYQWKKGANLIAGATLSSYTATTGGNYKVIVTNTVTGCSKTTGSATVVTVNALPSATITPQGPTTFCAGGSVVLKANAGTGLTYKWKKGGNNISGATLLNYTATTAGTYRVEVTSSNGCSKNSAGVVVTVPCREGEIIYENSFNVKVFPNPSSGDFTLDFDNEMHKNISVRVYDVVEKLILSDVTNNSQFIIHNSQLNTGIYFVEITNGETKKILKLVKNQTMQ